MDDPSWIYDLRQTYGGAWRYAQPGLDYVSVGMQGGYMAEWQPYDRSPRVISLALSDDPYSGREKLIMNQLTLATGETDYFYGYVLNYERPDLGRDSDGDGIIDALDIDLDGDGIWNAADTDRDGDGVDNDLDSHPSDPNQSVDTDADSVGDSQDWAPEDPLEQFDFDRDGVGNNADNCVSVANPDQLNTDGDDSGNACDADDDNDGVSDIDEATNGTNPLLVDTDGDGVSDLTDVFPLDKGESVDTDSDGVGNNADPDDDGDGQADGAELACGSDPLNKNSISTDTDDDGLPNCKDTDDDGDGYSDSSDLFPLDGNDWADADLDGIGDNADLDDDNDGVPDDQDAFPYDPLSAADADGDGIADEWEQQYGLDPTSAEDAFSDPDLDGVLNWEEFILGTNPTIAEYQAQIVSLDRQVVLSPSLASTINFNYSVSDSNYQLSGLGLRVHYDSRDFERLSFGDVLERGLSGLDNNVYQDIEDFDNDSNTDSYILIAWSPLAGNWPGGNGDRFLFALVATASDSALASGSAVIRFTSSSVAEGYNLSASSAYLSVKTATLDVDGDGEAKALTDGLLVLRYLFGFRSVALISLAIGENATLTDADSIVTRLDAIEPFLDVDGDGQITALTDGLLILRYQFGFRGNTLINGAIGDAATRTDAESIEDYLSELQPN